MSLTTDPVTSPLRLLHSVSGPLRDRACSPRGREGTSRGFEGRPDLSCSRAWAGPAGPGKPGSRQAWFGEQGLASDPAPAAGRPGTTWASGRRLSTERTTGHAWGACSPSTGGKRSPAHLPSRNVCLLVTGHLSPSSFLLRVPSVFGGWGDQEEGSTRGTRSSKEDRQWEQ